jgi:alpha-L-fucosidase 2
MSTRGRRSFVSTGTASTWNAGLIVGSGRVGAVLWGDASEHVVSLSHERFFVPANATTPPPRFAAALPAIRAALIADDVAGAVDLVNQTTAAEGITGLIWTDPLGPAAELRISTGSTTVQDYRRSLDFLTGEISIDWKDASGTHELRVHCPRGGERVGIRLRSSAASSVSLHFGSAQDSTADLSDSRDYANSVTVEASAVDDSTPRLSVSGKNPATGRVVSAITTLGLSAVTRMDVTREEAVVRLEGHANAWTVMDIDLSVKDGGAEQRAELGDHAQLQAASWLDLRSGIPEELSTEKLLSLAPDRDDAERGLIELAFAAGRHNIIASTGVLPATLQGVWQGTWSPAWSADYTLNGNVQNGGIASLIPTGTPQLITALTRLLVPHLEDFRTNASRIFGVPGAMLPSRMSTHGLANHFGPDFPHQFWIGCGGWILRMLADAVLATGDRRLVDDATWELVQEVLDFYRAIGAVDPIAPGYSPENTPAGRITPITVDPAMDVAILRDVERSGRLLAEARGAEPIQLPEVGARFRIEEGNLAEWSWPGQPDTIAHRHTSQLYPLWYETDPAFENGELREAAGHLIRAKIAWRAENPGPPPGNMEMAFGLTQLGLAAATLGDSESLEQCIRWLAQDHFTAAMTTTHDAGVIFNLDASGGLPTLVAAALVQSTRETISVLPALPTTWPAGTVGGLTTRTGLRVEELEWNSTGLSLVLTGDPESAWVRSRGVELRLPRPAVRSGDSSPVRRIALPAGDRHVLRFDWA